MWPRADECALSGLEAAGHLHAVYQAAVGQQPFGPLFPISGAGTCLGQSSPRSDMQPRQHAVMQHTNYLDSARMGHTRETTCAGLAGVKSILRVATGHISLISPTLATIAHRP